MLNSYRIFSPSLILSIPLAISLALAYILFYPQYFVSYNLKYPLFSASLLAFICLLCFWLSYKFRLSIWLNVLLGFIALVLAYQGNFFGFALSLVISAILLAQTHQQELAFSKLIFSLNLCFGIIVSYLCYQSADFLSLEIISLSLLLIKMLIIAQED